MNTELVLSELKKYANIFEIYQKFTFEGYHNNKSGDPQKIEIEILDAGPESPEIRYHCTAKTADGKTATGNPASTMNVALHNVHWNELDC